MAKRKFQALRGVKDILPEEQPYWLWVEDAFRQAATAFGFERIIVPTLEKSDLFIRSVGRGTDIIRKEMYTFKDKGGETVSLRPEFTASVVRAYIERGLFIEPKPVKLWSYGPVFRYDRPQKGRYREFYQVNYEIFGAADPMTDAQAVWLADSFYKKLGLKGIVFHLNTLGCAKCRGKILQTLRSALGSKKRKLCSDCRQKLKDSPLRVLDCKVTSCQGVLNEVAASLVDSVCEACREHFTRVLELLDGLGINYELNPRLVRGLDYYTRTTFEAFLEGESPKKRTALGGGGRYDILIRELGGPDTPAIGFAGGVERTIEALKQQGVKIPVSTQVELFLVQVGTKAQKKILDLMRELTQEGLRVGSTLGKESLKAQLGAADRAGSLFSLIVGDQEMRDGTVIVRDMRDRYQETILDRNLLKHLKAKLGEKKPP